MIHSEHLYQGLCGLANAHQAGSMAGHLGAAVCAGCFYAEDQSDLPDEVVRGVEGELKRIIAGEEKIWFNAKKTGLTPTDLFRPLPKEPSDAGSIKSIVQTLQKNVGTLKQSGHNIIFASTAVRALRDHEDYATQQIVTGIRKLTAGFDHAPPGRGYYGNDQDWLSGNQVKLSVDNNFPMYESIRQMVDVTINELIATAAIRKQGFGGLWHIINHAAAITELDRFGYREVAKQGLPAHHHHIRLYRSLPDVESELGAVVKAEYDPRDPVYWDGMLKRDDARLTHRIKTLYGFYTLRRFIKDEATRMNAEDAFLYLMA